MNAVPPVGRIAANPEVISTASAALPFNEKSQPRNNIRPAFQYAVLFSSANAPTSFTTELAAA